MIINLGESRQAKANFRTMVSCGELDVNLWADVAFDEATQSVDWCGVTRVVYGDYVVVNDKERTFYLNEGGRQASTHVLVEVAICGNRRPHHPDKIRAEVPGVEFYRQINGCSSADGNLDYLVIDLESLGL
jgi:hypothetical protein